MSDKKKDVYLIDTENVGDRWMALADVMGKKDRMIVFYTKNHSRQLEEYLLAHVYDPRFTWLECTTGNNALDYQLIGVLAYLIAKKPDRSYHIFSNDQGYKSVTDAWKLRGISITLDGFDEKKKPKKKKEKPKDEPAITPVDLSGEEQIIKALCAAIPMSNHTAWYTILTMFFGQESGRDWYVKIRDDKELTAALARNYKDNLTDRASYVVGLFLRIKDEDPQDAETIAAIVRAHAKKNLKDCRSGMEKKFGKDKGQQYYKLLKPALAVVKELA